jgi:pimeloyl-ACP methyl ester carboxylesterase
MKGLVRNDDGTFQWRFNLSTLTGDYNRINVALPQGQYTGPTLFMAGERSNYIQKDDHALIHHHFPQAQIQVIPNAGHWIHAEQPQAFLETLLTFAV